MSDSTAELVVKLRGDIGDLSQKMTAAVSTLQGAESKIKTITKGVETAITAAFVVAGGYAVKKLTESFVDLAKAGDAAASVRDSFEKMGGSAKAIDDATKSTLGLADSFDLMKVANEGFVQKIPNLNQNFKMITEYAMRFSDTMKIDVKDGLEQVIDAVGKAKPKMLEQIGIVVNSDRAMLNYAKSHGIVADAQGKFVLKMTEEQKKLALQEETLRVMPDTMKKFAISTAGVGDSFDAIGVAIGEAYKRIGTVIDNNEDLKKTFVEIQDAIKSIDWESIGSGLSTLITLAAKATDTLIGLVRVLVDVGEKAAEAFDTRSTAQKTFDAQIKKAEQFSGALEDLNKHLSLAANQGDLEKLKGEFSSFGEKYESFLKTNSEGMKGWMALNQQANELTKTLPKAKDNVDKFTFDKTGDSAKKAADEIVKLKDKWQDTLRSFDTEQINKLLQKSIDTLNAADFNALKERLRKNTEDGFLDGMKESIAKGAVSLSDATTQAKLQGQAAVDDVTKRFEDKSKEAYESSIQTWQSLFENAITGVTFNLKDALKQVAVGFAAEMAQAIFGNIGGGGITSPQGLGGAIFNSLFGDAIKSQMADFGSSLLGGNSLSGILGLSSAGAAAGGAGNVAAISPEVASSLGIGVASSAGGGTVLAGGGSVAGASLSSAAIAVAPYAAAAVVAYMGYKYRDKLFGVGTMNKETAARQDFGGWIEEQLKGKGGIFGPKGLGTNFVVGANNRFDAPGWADKLTSSKNFDVWTGLGEALKKTAGITEDIAPQIGALLQENLNDNLDKARLLVQKLGISMDDMINSLVDIGKTGTKSWHEIEVEIRGVTKAYEPGLEAVADIKGAFQEIVDSGGRGIEALKAVKDTAVEAIEAGAKTFEDFKQKAVQQGVDPALVDAEIKSAQQRGIKSLQDLANASDRIGGGIVSDIEDSSAALAEKWHQMAAQIDEINVKMNGIPKEIDTKINLKVTSDIDSNTQTMLDAVNAGNVSIDLPKDSSVAAHAMGGIFKSRSFINGGRDLVGEHGAEAVLPLTAMSNGRLGVSANVSRGSQIIINAQGAERGVHEDIERMIRDMGTYAINEAVNKVYDNQRRAG